ncbi:MAG: 1,4-dihydroxy-2-naphthoate octaprenyltransferase [Actinomycetota bacterium]
MNRWLVGARLRTLPAAVVPVALGASLAAGESGAVWWRVVPAGIVSLALQVGVNYANDYSDGVRGTDDDRVGPTRLVASGLAEPSEVKQAAFSAFGVAALAGLVLAAATTWWLVAVGALAVLAAWGYTGGPKPYGYLGLGEVFVFVFFGLVATLGTVYVVIERLPFVSWLVGSAAGSLACALLVTNNLRDIEGDSRVGKRTLAVRLGDERTRRLYAGFMLAALGLLLIAAPWRPGALVGLLAFPWLRKPVRGVLRGVRGRALIAVLADTGRFQLIVGALATIGIALVG